MAVVKTARFRVTPGSEDAALAAIREFVAAIGRGEPKTTLYASYRSTESPNEFLHVMAFEDAEGEAFHRETEWVKRFVEVLYPTTEDGVTFTDYTEVATA